MLFLAPLLAFFGACLLEALLLRPRCGWRRPVGAWALQAGLILAVYALGLALLQRPWFAAAQTLAWYLFILVVNRVKLAALREPFVFQDFEYFTDLLRHPRLYLPFFGYFNAFLGVSGAALLIAAGVTLETGLWQQGAGAFWLTLGLSAAVTLGLLWLGALAARGLQPSFEAQADVARFGLLASLWLYARAERVVPVLPSRFAGLAVPEGAAAPHVVVVQSESFFDARRVYEGVAPSVYAWLDKARADAVQHGLLDVPAWGANTVRSEFAFLSGLRDDALGVHRFNPYRCLREVDTLAQALRRAGYRTVCVHPYAAGFYRRDRQFPLFGFDEFIDVGAFSVSDRAGAYVGDVALAEKVAELRGISLQEALDRILPDSPENPEDSTVLFGITVLDESLGEEQLEEICRGALIRAQHSPVHSGVLSVPADSLPGAGSRGLSSGRYQIWLESQEDETGENPAEDPEERLEEIRNAPVGKLVRENARVRSLDKNVPGPPAGVNPGPPVPEKPEKEEDGTDTEPVQQEPRQQDPVQQEQGNDDGQAPDSGAPGPGGTDGSGRAGGENSGSGNR